MTYGSESEAIARLSRNGISVSNKTILVKRSIGLKLWGAVDYLKRFGYVVIR